MVRRNAEPDPVLDVSDVGWWVVFGFIAVVPLLLIAATDWPWWSAVPFAFVLGMIAAPLYRRYKEKWTDRQR